MIISHFNWLLAQQTQLEPNPTGALIKQFALFGVIIVVMYVLMFLPQRKRQKELDSLVKSLKAGDKVVTTSGIVGVVLSVKDRSVAIRSAESKLEVLKSSVAEVTDRGGEAVETKQ